MVVKEPPVPNATVAVTPLSQGREYKSVPCSLEQIVAGPLGLVGISFPKPAFLRMMCNTNGQLSVESVCHLSVEWMNRTLWNTEWPACRVASDVALFLHRWPLQWPWWSDPPWKCTNAHLCQVPVFCLAAAWCWSGLQAGPALHEVNKTFPTSFVVVKGCTRTKKGCYVSQLFLC